jgi:hypothetical protein
MRVIVTQVNNNSGGGGGSSVQVKRLTADVPNATAAPVALPDLTVNVVAGKSYVGELVTLGTSDEGPSLVCDLLGGSATFTGQWAETTNNTTGDLTTALPGGGGTTIFQQVYQLYLTCSVSGTVIPRFISNDPGTAHAVAKAGSTFTLSQTSN